jgi:SAM-dependent methyltransferase
MDMDLKDTYNRIAEDWHKDHQQDNWWVEGTDAFISLLPEGASVLDVGCGGGFKSRYLAERGLQVTGIDFSEKLIGIASRESVGIDFKVMRMQDVPSLPQEFDGIFAQASLLHIPRDEIQSVLSGLVSKLKALGYLYVAVKGPKEGKPLEETKMEDDYGYEYSRFFSYHSLDELCSYFDELGLETVYTNVARTGNTDWVQVIGRKLP